MAIEVTNLSKTYGSQKAVDKLSFTANKGEILGFLGPNGAGKSTTLKMICGYVQPTDGAIQVCGIDGLEHPLQTKEKIGYLPEANPLYMDMYVIEYLRFVAGLRKVKDKNNRIEGLLEETGLNKESHKKIFQLSKGYKQRVGIAQALLNDPEVLILDEPTAGLDPNQLVEIRALIKRLGQEKTLIFSSHIMQEVEALCDKVIIINDGKLVANGTIDAIQSQLEGKKSFKVRFDKPIDANRLIAREGVLDVVETKHEYIVYGDSPVLADEIFKFAVDNQLIMRSLIPQEQNIEQVFQKLTYQSAK